MNCLDIDYTWSTYCLCLDLGQLRLRFIPGLFCLGPLVGWNLSLDICSPVCDQLTVTVSVLVLACAIEARDGEREWIGITSCWVNED